MKTLRADVHTASVIKNAVSWDVMSCSSEERTPTVCGIKGESLFETSVNSTKSHGIAFLKTVSHI